MIRKAEEQDIHGIMELLLQVANVHADGRPDLFVANHRKYTVEEVRGIISNDSTPVFVYVSDSEVIEGYCFCIIKEFVDGGHFRPHRSFYIDDLCVDEKHRGRGIGRRLYEYVKIFAREMGCHNVTLNVWACNPSAIRFYESLGMQIQKIGMEEIMD